MLDRKTLALQKRMNAWVKEITPVIQPMLMASKLRNQLNKKLAAAVKAPKNTAEVKRLRKALKELDVAEKEFRNS